MQSANKGRFQKGSDPRRHTFTREECIKGFLAAEASIARRYPGCDPHFMMCALIGSRPWNTLPQIRDLRDCGPLSDEEALRRFGREN
jgi:hypothetical protein